MNSRRAPGEQIAQDQEDDQRLEMMKPRATAGNARRAVDQAHRNDLMTNDGVSERQRKEQKAEMAMIEATATPAAAD